MPLASYRGALAAVGLVLASMGGTCLPAFAQETPEPEQTTDTGSVAGEDGNAVEADMREQQSPTESAEAAAEGDAPSVREGAAASHGFGEDTTIWGLIMAAGPVVKAVMLVLVLASVATWTIFLVKLMTIRSVASDLKAQRRRVDEADDLSDLRDIARTEGSRTTLFLRPAYDAVAPDGTVSVNERRLARAQARSATARTELSERLTSGLNVLATVGSASPFVGLFGTVWGIMISFIGIAQTQTTNLAVVAPGIAEALIATAMGLVAAIPAVVIYNYFARRIGVLQRRMSDLSSDYISSLDRADRHMAGV